MSDTVQTTISLPRSSVERLDAKAKELSRPGIVVSRAAVVRIAIEQLLAGGAT